MRNIIIFIRVYFTFFFFLFLLGLSLYMLFSYDKFHNAVYSKVANEVTGRINEQYNKVTYYFYLKQTNDSLVKANEQLYNKLKADFNIPDSLDSAAVIDINTDSISSHRRFLYREAKVIRNSVSRPNNYIILNRGRDQGITTELGVLGPNGGVAGSVVEVSKNFSVVLSLLHSQSNVSARLMKGGETGTLVWDGLDRNILILKDITKSARIHSGDTVVTSGFSDKFPAGLIIGYVKDIVNEKASSTYKVRVYPAVNFETLQFVYIIEDLQRKEIDGIMDKFKDP